MASPSAVPGLRLKESVTAGSWPTWFTDSGPRLVPTVAIVLRGTSWPAGARTYSIERAVGSLWYWGATCRITWY